MFCVDKIVQLLRRRFRCDTCSKIFLSINPKFLSQLPTVMLHKFPFVTTANGPGIHKSTVYQFMKLSTNKILFATFAHIVNEIHSIKFYASMLS